MSRERHQAAGPTDNSALLDLSIWLMISMYLYVDTISGVLIGIMGGQAPLSQVWKGGILFLILLVSVKRSLTTILLSGASAVMLLVGPFYRLLATPNASGFGFESATALKALMPLVILLWCMDQQTARHRLIEIWPLRALWSAVLAVILNMMLGLAGLGNSTYGTGEHGIGIIGFFYAGNELGAVFTALSGFVLMWTWCRRRKIYVLVAGVVALIGVLIATKAAMLSAVMLALMVPAANQRGQWGKMPAGVAISLFILLVALAITMARVWFILEAAGLADRLQYAYSRRGWTGILFSGRDSFLADSAQLVWEFQSLADMFFGPGLHQMQQLAIKSSVEMDPVDFYLWFGVPGLFYLTIFVAIFIYLPLRAKRDPRNVVAPALLVTTWVLLGISIIAGHVILGSLAGPAWAMFTALAFTNWSTSGEQRSIASPLSVTSASGGLNSISASENFR